MHPGSIFKWHDNSGINQNNTAASVDNSPLYFTISSFDRGPEDIRIVSDDFYSLYGSKMNFSRHGQPALQAANIINGGGRLLIKRLVANDALLANTIGVAVIEENISTVKATAEDTSGRTLGEILNGVTDEPVVYVEELELTSMIGSTDDSTAILVETDLTSGNSYKWRVTDSDLLPEVGSIAGKDFNDWDGSSDIAVADGTKVQIVECDINSKIIKSAVVNVVSRVPHPAKTSVAPENGLNALYITSKEGTNEGYTELVVSPIIAVGNKYFYKTVSETESVTFPEVNSVLTEADMESWTEWNGVDQLQIAEATNMILVEFSLDEEDPAAITYSPEKGASVVVVSKLPEDTRTANAVPSIMPETDKYIVSGQTNSVKWEALSIINCKTPEEVLAEAAKLYTEKEPAIVTNEDGSVTITKTTTYPLFVISDNGRGVSNKAVRFVPDYTTSKDMKNMFYNVYVYEGTTLLETSMCTMNPSGVFNNTLYGLNHDTSIQVKFDVVTGIYDKYVEHLSLVTGYSIADLTKYDVMFLTNNKGAALNNIFMDANSIDFGADFGVALQNGSNGEFGDTPFGTEAYIKAAIEVLDGTYDDIIWDRDTYKICAIFDANFPEPVKDKFAEFVNFREDCVFFRDYGIDVKSYASIVDHYNNIDVDYKTKFNMEYYTTYEIYDPETKVRERVTMMYDFARAMVNHFATGVYRPLAGVINNMILTSAIEGTINFTPRITPKTNQKALLDDLRINYAIFEEGRCVVQSLYTSQPDYTQLSYGNNVLAIQEVVRAVRISCPKQRFTFTSGNDFSSYADAVNNVLKGFKSNFKTLEFGYEQDNLKAAQKIFYASIYFTFNNWAQTEQFDLFALGDE